MEDLPFPSSLDRPFLYELYANDAEYAALMFGLFLEEIIPQVKGLSHILEQQDWPHLHQEVHKIKPTFGMVGLTGMVPLFDRLEATTDIHHARQVISTIHEELARALPVVQMTYAHLKNHQNEN